eukprot:scaffold60738_cov59-Phaeocystis_antarctica.AAC.3
MASELTTRICSFPKLRSQFEICGQYMPKARVFPCLHLSYTSIDDTTDADPFIAHCCHANRQRRVYSS